MLPIASCAQPRTARVALTPPASSAANSRTSSVTDHAVPCSSLVLGKVSTNDTVGTLGWVLPLMKAIEATCGSGEPAK
jgi:hypothetical protein